MDVPVALDLAREALVTTLLIAGPVLAIGVLVGLVISLVQTVTQLNDQTLSIVPKIVAMVVAAIVFFPWVAQRTLEYTRQLFSDF